MLTGGTTANPVRALYRDGIYHVEVTSYAWDTTQSHTCSLEVELSNFDPVARGVYHVLPRRSGEVAPYGPGVVNGHPCVTSDLCSIAGTEGLRT